MNQPTRLDLPVMDIEAFRDRAGNDAELIVELIELFLTECPAQLKKVQHAIAETDCVGLMAAAHILKGTLLSFSATQSAYTVAGLEEMGKTGDLRLAPVSCDTLVHELECLSETLLKVDPSSHCANT